MQKWSAMGRDVASRSLEEATGASGHSGGGRSAEEERERGWRKLDGNSCSD